jgi:hypothetical protein
MRRRADLEVPQATEDMIDRVHDLMVETINKTPAGTPRQEGRPFHTWQTIEHDSEKTGFAEAEGASGTNDFIALILQHGSRPHVIEPKNAKALRFAQNGRMVFYRRVNHPGTRAYRWLDRAVMMADAYNRQRWHKAARRILYGEEY